MPFVSGAQNKWAHTPEGVKALGGPEKVKEWESSTDYSNLPEQAPKKNTMGMKKPPKIGGK